MQIYVFCRDNIDAFDSRFHVWTLKPDIKIACRVFTIQIKNNIYLSANCIMTFNW